jgi:hypothetical protein
MQYLQPTIFKIVPSGDYLHVVCEKCGGASVLDFKGYDSAVPLIEITCPKCGSSGTWKLWMGGHGFGKPNGSSDESETQGCAE